MLGVDKGLVSRLKKRGMPTGTLEAAQAWRHDNLNYVQRKDVNPVRDWHRLREGTPAAARAALESVSQLIPLAIEAAKAGQFGLVRKQLEDALAAVPASHQAQVGLPVQVWDALVGKNIDAMEIAPAEKACAAVANAEEFELPGRLCYAMATGRALPPELKAELATLASDAT